MRGKYLALVFVLFVAAESASAAVIYSNLGPGQSYSNGVGEGEPVTSGSTHGYAVSFVAGSPFTLNSVTLALGYDMAPATIPVSIELRNDNGSGPGTILESWPDIPTAPYTAASDLQTFTSTGTSLLYGQTYWLAVTSPPNTGGRDIWNFNNTGAMGYDFSSDLTTWTPIGNLGVPLSFALEVDGTATPEPMCIGLLCAAPLLLSRRRR